MRTLRLQKIELIDKHNHQLKLATSIKIFQKVANFAWSDDTAIYLKNSSRGGLRMSLYDSTLRSMFLSSFSPSIPFKRLRSEINK